VEDKELKTRTKRIYNPVTGNYYPVRPKTITNRKAGQIKGLWKEKKI